jgi:hypothetical protein
VVGDLARDDEFEACISRLGGISGMPAILPHHELAWRHSSGAGDKVVATRWRAERATTSARFGQRAQTRDLERRPSLYKLDAPPRLSCLQRDRLPEGLS